jgi:hypothetical protein
MGRSAYLAIICATAALSLPASAFSEPLQDVAPQMRKDAECMATTLKKIPVIDQVKVGIYRDGRMILPYVSFRAAPDRHGYRYTVAYAAYMACPMTVLVCAVLRRTETTASAPIFRVCFHRMSQGQAIGAPRKSKSDGKLNAA